MDYKSYYSVKPCQNRILQMKWDKKYYEEHIKKIASAQPKVDTCAPKTFTHIHLKMGKLKQEEAQLYAIERENRLLLEKMTFIMRTHGAIDNQNNYKPISANKVHRQRELLRIGQENQKLMERLARGKSFYDHHEWERDYSRSRQQLKHLCNFPPIDPPQSRTKSRSLKSAPMSPTKKLRESAKSVKSSNSQTVLDSYPENHSSDPGGDTVISEAQNP